MSKSICWHCDSWHVDFVGKFSSRWVVKGKLVVEVDWPVRLFRFHASQSTPKSLRPFQNILETRQNYFKFPLIRTMVAWRKNWKTLNTRLSIFSNLLVTCIENLIQSNWEDIILYPRNIDQIKFNVFMLDRCILKCKVFFSKPGNFLEAMMTHFGNSTAMQVPNKRMKFAFTRTRSCHLYSYMVVSTPSCSKCTCVRWVSVGISRGWTQEVWIFQCRATCNEVLALHHP